MISLIGQSIFQGEVVDFCINPRHLLNTDSEASLP